MSKTINFNHLVGIMFDKDCVELTGERVENSNNLIKVRIKLPILYTALSVVKEPIYKAKEKADRDHEDYLAAVGRL